MRTSRWAHAVAGVACLLMGAFLVLHPFASLAVLVVAVVAGLVVLAIGHLAGDHDLATRRWSVGQGVVALAAAVALLVWPGPGIRVLAVVVGVALAVSGVLDLAAARAAHGTARWNAVVSGVTALVFGVLALVWPDVTVLVVAVVFGARVVVLGVRLVVSAVRPERRPVGETPRARPGGWRLAGHALGLLAALALAVVGVGLARGAATPDAFYAAPTSVPAQPGQLLRSEPFRSPEIPAGASAWRILYTTTRAEGEAALASGLVVVPDAARAGGAGAPARVIAWAHGTTGATPGCAISIGDEGFAHGAFFLADRVIAQGWAIVATDYIGLGTAGPHPYLVGRPAGRAVLDALRAARQLRDVRLADDTVVWGHSQGGGAALWTGVLAPAYAPELKIDGIAALAPASNVPALLRNLQNVTGGALFASYVAEGYTSTYPDVRFDEYVRPGAQVIAREMADRCLGDPGVLVSVVSSLVLDGPIWRGDPDRGALHDRLVQNIPSGPIAAPLLVAQGEADTLVVPAAQDAYVAARCAAGYAVDYRTYPGRDHVPLVQADSPLVPDLLSWTRGRFTGEPAGNSCRKP